MDSLWVSSQEYQPTELNWVEVIIRRLNANLIFLCMPSISADLCVFKQKVKLNDLL